MSPGRPQHERILATATQLSTAIATLPQPMAILRSIRDQHGTVVDFQWTFVNNAAAESIPSVKGLVGTRLLDLVPDHPRSLFDAYVRVVDTGEPVTIEDVGYDGTWGPDPGDARAAVSVRATKVDDGLAIAWTVGNVSDGPVARPGPRGRRASRSAASARSTARPPA